MYTHTHMCIYIYIYVYMHTYVHTYMGSSKRANIRHDRHGHFRPEEACKALRSFISTLKSTTKISGGTTLSNTTCLTHGFFKRGEPCSTFN